MRGSGVDEDGFINTKERRGGSLGAWQPRGARERDTCVVTSVVGADWLNDIAAFLPH